LSRARQILLLGVFAVLGCSNNNGTAVSYAFNRPESLEFACFAQYASTGTDGKPTTDPSLNGRWAVVPRACCASYDTANEPYKGPTTRPIHCYGDGGQPLKTPALHAIVTQSTRGEVAAVDLTANRVLDSDRQVPGFTFLDTGGLPTAIVVPPYRPNGTETEAPTFFYVASAEQQEIRAIPLCRFRAGSSCGPDLLPENANDPNGYAARLRVPLPGPPEDMVLGPDQALYVTMPAVEGANGVTSGVIARIALPAAGVTADAFALGSTGIPTFFGVPAVQDVAMPEPILDPVDYQASCGLGYSYAATSFTLPIAPRVKPLPIAQPARLRWDTESGLLFVSDRASPGLHVFAPAAEGRLEALGALPTGQPLREFVITPRVPTGAVAGLGLVARTTPPDVPASETKRYLYGIDIDGRVALFGFAAEEDGELPTLTPLLAPDPDLSVLRYADRIDLPVPAQSLDVIDTRTQLSYVCGEDPVDDLRATRSRLRDQKEPLNAEQRRVLQRTEARLGIYEDAAADYVRGVFVAVASMAGRLSLIDIHDLDSSCRAQKFCCASAGASSGVNGVPVTCMSSIAELNTPRGIDSQESLMVRRHTWRRRAAGPQTVDVATASLLAPLTCDPNDPSASVRSSDGVCTPADPYKQLTENWNVEYQGMLPGSSMGYAHWEPGPLPHQLQLVAPTESNLCARGVELDDLVAVVGRAPESKRGSGCPDPSADTAPLFKVVEARADRLLVEGYDRELKDATPMELQEQMAATATTCYRDFVGVELRAGGFLVLGSNGTYLHRITTAPDGRCVADLALDPRLNARVRDVTTMPNDGSAPITTPDLFQNPFVTFRLAPPMSPNPVQETRETTVSVSRASVPFYVDAVNSRDSVTDALPSTVHYLPEVGNLFLLDIAGQGLRRYSLRPFERDDTVFR
jgi:hypothetical protein